MALKLTQQNTKNGKERSFKVRKVSILVILISLLFAVGFLVYLVTYEPTILKKPQTMRETGGALIAEQSIDEIAKTSDAVVIGKVISISEAKFASKNNKFYEDANIYKDIVIQPEEFLKNHLNLKLASPVVIKVLGGTIKLPSEIAAKKGLSEDSDLVRTFEDEVSFDVGEKVVVFLKKGFIGYKENDSQESKMSRIGVNGGWQGKFRVEGDKAVNVSPSRNTTIKELRRLSAE